MSRILVVDDEPADLNLVRRALEKHDHEVLSADSAKEGIRLLRRSNISVCVLDVMLPDGNGLDILKKIREIDERMPVIFVTSGSDSGTAIRAMQLGALDYLLKPINVSELREVVNRAIEIRRLTQTPVRINFDNTSHEMDAIIGRCDAMQEVYKSIGIVAAQDVTVLIRGESGTGKELVARALYQYGERVQGPFLAVNCAAIPETLLESELFGHEKGAFTGADRKRIGKFEQCSGGTLFLDEIGDMSPMLQSKLLRVLQEKRFERVGGNETITVDTRVIAATHRNLEEMVSRGEFRADLYYRLNGFTIHLPPLRDRGDDLELLIEHFRRHSCIDLKKDVHVISPAAIEVMRRYHWPGNVRELQNAVRQAILKTTGPALVPAFLPDFVHRDRKQNEKLSADSENVPSNPVERDYGQTAIDPFIKQHLRTDSPHLYDDVIGEVECNLVQQILELTGGDKAEAARKLGINPVVLRSRAALDLLDLQGFAEDETYPTPLIRPGMTLAEIETEAIRRALRRTGGCRKEAAKLLGISTRTMQRRVKELKLTESGSIV